MSEGPADLPFSVEYITDSEDEEKLLREGKPEVSDLNVEFL